MSADNTNTVLLVFTEPGDNVPPEQFEDWYNNEFIPSRLAIPGIKNAIRLIQVDGQKPTWGALYDLDSPAVLERDDYKALFANQSAREIDVLNKTEIVDRRTYEGPDTPALHLVKPGYTGIKEGGIIIIGSVEFEQAKEADFQQYFENEHGPQVAKAPGWKRTRVVGLVDHAVRGTKVSGEVVAPPKYLAIHEFEDAKGPASSEFQEVANDPQFLKWMSQGIKRERRVMKVYKTFGPGGKA